MAKLLDPDATQIDVNIADLIIATHDAADPQVHPRVRHTLQALRLSLGMDVVFVSRNMAGSVRGTCGLMEASWCEYVARYRLGDLPIDTGTFASASVELEASPVYGTLGCISDDAQRASRRMGHRLELAARLLAEELEQHAAAVPLNARPASYPPHAMAAVPCR